MFGRETSNAPTYQTVHSRQTTLPVDNLLKLPDKPPRSLRG